MWFTYLVGERGSRQEEEREMRVYDGRPGAKDRPKPTAWVGGAGHYNKRGKSKPKAKK